MVKYLLNLLIGSDWFMKVGCIYARFVFDFSCEEKIGVYWSSKEREELLCLDDVDIWSPFTVVLGLSDILGLSYISVEGKDECKCLLGIGCGIEVFGIGTTFTSVDIF